MIKINPVYFSALLLLLVLFACKPADDSSVTH